MRRLLFLVIILTIALTFGLFDAHVLAAPVTPSVYEAENGVYLGGAHSQPDPNASGEYIAAYFGDGTSVAITVDGGEGGDYQLTMIYAAAINDRTMSLYVNNAHISDLRFPGTGGYTTYSTLNTNITLQTGMNIITLQVDNGDGDTGDVNFDYITLAPGKIPEKTLEKIEITRSAAKLSYRIGESLDITGIEVTGTYNDGSIQVEPITAADVTGFDSSAQVYSQVLTVTYKGQTAAYTVTITAPDLTPGKYEAENGAYSGGAHSQPDPNASGAYIAAYFGNGTSVAIIVDGGEGGDYQLSMIYAAAINDRTMSLYINNAHISDLRFPGTGGYTTYSTLNTNITLHTGMNIITLQVDNGEGDTGDVNFDYIILAPGKTVEYNLETQICPVKDNKQAIWTFTTDDGIYNSVVQYNNLFKKYGLKGTVALNPYTIQDTDNGLNWSIKDGLRFYCGTWNLWQTLIADGKLDIANHTATHPHLTQIPQSELDSEINGARSILMSHLNGQSILGFIDPYGESDYYSTSVIQQQHFADRSTVEGENSLSPDDYSWYHLLSYYALSGVTVETMNSWIDSTIANKSWCIELWHGILSDQTESETLWSPLTYDICNDHLSYVANNLDKIWNATYSEAIQYLRERQSATLSVLSFDNTHIRLSLTDSLDNSIFNYPLTLKVQVPNDWASVSIMQNGNSHNIIPATESGNNYVYFDAIPDQGNIDIAKVILERIEITKPATKLSYAVGESLDITGIEVTGIYSDGRIQIEPITAADVTGFDSSVPIDSQVLTVTYGKFIE